MVATTRKPTKQTAAVERKAAPQSTVEAPSNTKALAVAAVGSGAVALPEDLMSQFAKEAKDAAAKERPSVSRISLQGGIIQYMGNPVPDNTLDAIVVASVFRNTFYMGAFNPNQIVNPNCYALAEEEDDLKPYDNVKEPEHETCEGCPMGEWESAGGGSRAKACKQSRRLVIMPASALEDIEAIKTGELAVLDIPVTSVKNWSNMVNTLSAGTSRPVWSFVISFTTEADPKTQFKLEMTATQQINSEPMLRAIMARRNEALRLALAPYDGTMTAAEVQAMQKPARTSKKF